MMKNLLFSWLWGATKPLCFTNDMLKSDPSCLEDALNFLKELLGQPLSEETKDELIRNIEYLSSTFRSLQEENQRLRGSLRRIRHVTFSPKSRAAYVQVPTPPCGGGGMVDVLRKPELGPPRTGTRKPEPLRTRNGRDPPREVKFAKYPPLPAIQPKARPRLLRERTYDVIDPVYVKGPCKIEKPKLPEIKKPIGRQDVASPGNKSYTTPKPPSQIPTPKKNKKIQRIEHKREAFDPSTLAPPTDIPTNVFWFPM